MKHLQKTRRFDRTSAHRNAMFRNMVTSLIKHERIETTLPKAKELRVWAARMITLAKRGDLHARRQALEVIRDKQTASKLFDEIGPRYSDKQGGYTRITRIGERSGDGAPMALIELVHQQGAAKGPARKSEAKKSADKKKKKE